MTLSFFKINETIQKSTKWKVKKKKKSLLIGELYKTNRLTDIEDKSMGPKGKTAEGIN